MKKNTNLVSISPSSYEQLLHLYYFTIKLQRLTVSREKLRKTLSFKKDTNKMLVKLTPGLLLHRQIFQKMMGSETEKKIPLGK